MASELANPVQSLAQALGMDPTDGGMTWEEAALLTNGCKLIGPHKHPKSKSWSLDIARQYCV